MCPVGLYHVKKSNFLNVGKFFPTCATLYMYFQSIVVCFFKSENSNRNFIIYHANLVQYL